MANRYSVKYGNRRIALAHVLPHPRYKGQQMISVIPVRPENGICEAADGIGLKTALYGKCPDTQPDIEAILALVTAAGFKPEKIKLRPVNGR